MSHSNAGSKIGTAKEHRAKFIMLGLFLVGYLFGVYGYHEAFESYYHHASFLDCFYDAFGLVELKLEFVEHIPVPWQLNVGRWMVAVSVLWAGFTLVSSIAKNYFKLFWFGTFLHRQHTIVIFGASKIGYKLALSILQNKQKKVIIVDSNKDNHYLELLSEHGAAYLVGDPNDEKIIINSKAVCAAEVLCVTDNDAVNLSIYNKVNQLKSNYARQNPSSLRHKVFVHIKNGILFDKLADIGRKNNHHADKLSIIKKEFNTYQLAAMELFQKHPLNANVDTTIENNKLRLAILGAAGVGSAVLFEALQLGHFFNGEKMSVTWVDDKFSSSKVSHQLNMIDLNSNEIKEYFDFSYMTFTEFYQNELDYNTIIIAQDDENLNLVDAIKCENKYKKTIISNRGAIACLDVFVYVNSQLDQIVDVTYSSIDESNKLNIRSFGDDSSILSESVIINRELDKEAELLHENYEKNKNKPKHWENLPILQQNSNRVLYNHIMGVKRNEFLNIKPSNQSLDVNKFFDDYYIYELTNDNGTDDGINRNKREAKESFEKNKIISILNPDQIIQFAKAEHQRWNVFHLLRGWDKMYLPSADQNIMAENIMAENISQNTSTDRNEELKMHVCLATWEELKQVSKHYNQPYWWYDIQTILKLERFDKS